MAAPPSPTSRPMSVKEITAKAYEFSFNPSISLKTWLHTAKRILQEALIYENEGNSQQAYFMYMRYVGLVTDNLHRHPSARDPAFKRQMLDAIKTVNAVASRLEKLKPIVNSRYEAWQTQVKQETAARAITEQEHPPWNPAASDPAVAGNNTTLAAAENRELAVRLAHKEIRRRETARRGTRQAGISELEERQRRAAGLWDQWDVEYINDSRSPDEELQRDMQRARRRANGEHDIRPDGIKTSPLKTSAANLRRPDASARSGQTEYQYPSIVKSRPIQYEQKMSENPPRPASPSSPLYLPPKPPKEQVSYRQAEVAPPPKPEKLVPRPPEAISNGAEEASSAVTFRPSAYLENGDPLRTVWLPSTLREKFLALAAPNTRNNLETCGMLCGTLMYNALFVSKLVIPEQESTSDTCETVNESAFFDYCASEDLMVLGWIHTHPSQTCFMSSRDLHTHAGYQIMMPESFAIVCAPSKDPSWGVFRLTDPPGMQSVLNCRKTGLFHPHDEADIYTDALRPGHVFEAAGLNFDVVDMRP